MERAIRLRWGGASNFIVDRIKGAAAFAGNRTDRISGIQADDASGRITIELMAAYGAFDDVLALPALAPVPSGTPLRDEQSSPPPGVGPYRFEQVIAGRSFELARNPRWGPLNIPEIPSGHLDVDVRISSDLAANARAVLRNAAGVFDSADQIPADVLGRASTAGPDRYSRIAQNETYSLFLDPSERPFSSQLARQAVLAGLDRDTVARVAAGTLLPGCYLLPPRDARASERPLPIRRPARRGRSCTSQGARPPGRDARRAGRGPGRAGLAARGIDGVLHVAAQSHGFRASQRPAPGRTPAAHASALSALGAQTGIASFAEASRTPRSSTAS